MQVTDNQSEPLNRKKQKVQRYACLDTDASTWVSHYRDIGRVLLPRSVRSLASDRNDGDRQHNNIYDNTATRALRVMGAGMMAGATSPARPWFRLGTADPDMDKRHAVRVYLDDVARRILRVFGTSNTYRALHNVYEELGAFGTAVTVVLPDFDNVIHHYPVPAGEYRLAQDHRGRINTLYRKFERSVAEVVTEFGYEQCSTHVKNLWNKKNFDAPVEVMHAVEPRYERSPRMLDSLNMPWESCYFEYAGDDDKFLRVSGFEDFPVLSPRWAVTAGDVYGNSPGMESLGDIRQLQHEQLRKANGIDFMSNPPTTAPTAMKGKPINRMPGGVTFVDTNGPHGGIRNAFDVRLDLNHLLLDIQDVRQRIQSSFFADLFLMLAMAGSNTRMTATEVAERHEEKLLMLGPVLERLHTELLKPLVEMTFERMQEVGMLPPPPPELVDADVQVEFISMLAQAQRAIGANTVDRYVANLASIGEFKPEVLDKFDTDMWADEYADMLGVPPTFVRSTEDVAELRQARNEAMAAKEQAAAMQEQSQTAKNLSAADTSGPNALTDMMNQYSGYSSPSPTQV